MFQEKEPGKVSHTAASRFLATNAFARKWVEMYAEEILPAVVRTVDAITQRPNSGEPNHIRYSLANGTTEHCFDYMARYLTRAQRFGDAMGSFSSGPGYGPEALLEYFAAANLTEGTLIDLGGSHGAYSITLVRQFPKLRAIVQDGPEVVEWSSKNVPEDLADRLEYVTHDFFCIQPLRADVYLLHWILHNWSDEYCMKILRALIPALRPKNRVLIHEVIIPEPSQSSSHTQASIRYVS